MKLTAIHTPTPETFGLELLKLENQGYTWYNPTSRFTPLSEWAKQNNYWNNYKENTVLCLETGSKLTYCSRKFAEDEGYTVVTPGVPEVPKSLHQLALDNLALKPGDRVKVLFKVPGQTGGWTSVWVPPMDDAVGKILEVIEMSGVPPETGVPLRYDYVRYFPAFALELVSRASDKPKYPGTFGVHYVTVDRDRIKVGCQSFSFAEYDELLGFLTNPAPLNGRVVVKTLWISGHETDSKDLTKFLKKLKPAVEFYRDKEQQ